MEEPERMECIHHWIIETPAYKRRNYRTSYDVLGSWSRGICKKCKEERKFDNSPVTKQINVTSVSNRIKEQKEKEKSLQNDEN